MELETGKNKRYTFWDWFITVESRLRENLKQQDILKEMDEKISELGNFSWELGPGISKTFALVISPNCNKELLMKAKQIISLAPKLDNWEYHYAKPPKKWDLKFSFEGSNNNIQINAQDWEYNLLKYPDGMYDIIIKVPQVLDFSDSDLEIAAEILLIGILGEEKYMEVVDTIEVVKSFEPKFLGKSNNIAVLNKQLAKLSQ